MADAVALNDFELEADLEEGLEYKIGTFSNELEKNRFQSKRTPSGVSITSKASIKDLSRNIVKRLTNSSQVNPEEAETQASDRREIITYLSASQPRTASFLDACDWYATKFIDEKYKTYWQSIHQVVLNVGNENGCPAKSDVRKVDHVLATIAQELSKQKDLALVDVVNELINQDLIQDDGTDERVVPHQLMFRFLGWLTMLYDPRTDCKPNKLQVAKTCLNTSGNKVNLQSRTMDTCTQDFEYIDQSFFLLLGRFGKLIPDTPLRVKADIAPPSEWIIVPFVCYQTLRHVCHIEIEWVDVLSLHLEFDSSRKVLKIFRFPSFCRLMYRDKQRGLLSQLFDDKERDLHGSTSPQGSNSTSDFFHEMLLTYRLLFGQDTKSHRLFAKEMATALQPRKSKSRPFAGPTKANPKANPPSIFALPSADPLLPTLCAHPHSHPAAAALYADIHAPDPQAYYTPASYPFFAARLLALQGYVKEQNPHDWKALWHDHRDKSNWWQFWAVLFIGGGTLVLGLLSLVFQIVQVVLAQEQLAGQGAGPPVSRFGLV